MNTVALAGKVSDQFWPTIATIIPVLALALVVEARATINRWSRDIPWWIRSSQGLLWAYILVLFAIIELVAISDLAADETASAWAQAARLTIGQSFLVLVITPALSLFASANAGAAARAIATLVSSLTRWKLLRLTFRAKRERRSLGNAEKSLEKLMARVAVIEGDLPGDGYSGTPDYQEEQAEIDQIKKDIVDQLERIRERRRVLTDARSEIDDLKETIKREKKVLVAKLEKEIITGDAPSDATKSSQAQDV